MVAWWQHLVGGPVEGVLSGGFALAGATLYARRSADAELRRAECDELRRLATDLIRHSAAMGDAGVAREDCLAADIGARTAVAALRLSHPSVAGRAEALLRASVVPAASGSKDDEDRREAETRFASRVWARLEVLET